MGFPFNYYGMAFFAALVCSAGVFPLWRRWCLATGQVDAPGHRKIHDRPVPLAGGLTVMTGFFLPLLLGYLWAGHLAPETGSVVPVEYGFSRRAVQILAILGGALAMVTLGWVDDRHELGPGVKFGGQLLIAVAVAWSGIRITLFVESGWFSYAVTILWILALTNAFNFMDNMNGLCTGLGFISAWACAWSAATQGQYLVALLGFTICGALAGFLPFNFPRAAAFLGDAGSHLVGFLVAILAILPNFYSEQSPNALAVLSPLLIVGVPLVDLVWVVAWRTMMGKPFYVGDTNHLSHRLVRRGYSKSTAVLILWLFGAGGAALSFWLLG